MARRPRNEIPSPKEARETMRETSDRTPVGLATAHLWRIVYDVMVEGIAYPTLAERRVAEETAYQVAAMAITEGLYSKFTR